MNYINLKVKNRYRVYLKKSLILFNSLKQFIISMSRDTTSLLSALQILSGKDCVLQLPELIWYIFAAHLHVELKNPDKEAVFNRM